MKTITFASSGAAEDKKLLLQIVGSSPDGGYTIEQVRQGVKVLDKIQASADAIELEDAEYDFVKVRLGQMKWNVADPQVIAFYDAVLGAS